MGYLLILLKTVTNTGEGIFVKKYGDKDRDGGVLFSGFASAFVMIFFFAVDTDGFNFIPAMLPYAAAFGVLYAASFLMTLVAFGCGSFAVSMLILSYSVAFPVIYGIFFLHESVSAFTVAGIALLAVSLFLTKGEKKDDDKKASVKWVIMITLSCVGSGVLAVIQKIVQLKFDNACNNEFMALSLATAAVLLISAGAVRERKKIKTVLRYGIPYAFASGVCNGASNLLTMLANNLVPLAIAFPLSAGMKIVLSFVLSHFIFKEKYVKRQLIGVALSITALVFINIS